MSLENVHIKTLDISTPSLYKLVFSNLPKWGDGVDQFTLNVHTSPIPGINLPSTEFPFQGGIHKQAEGKLNFNDWSIEFMVDEEYSNWYFIYKWMTFINNAKDDYLEKHVDYSADATLILLNNWKKEIKHIKFIDIWPTDLSDINLSFRSGLEYNECSATFMYDRFEVINL